MWPPISATRNSFNAIDTRSAIRRHRGICAIVCDFAHFQSAKISNVARRRPFVKRDREWITAADRMHRGRR
jgi:hypothetical protein